MEQGQCCTNSQKMWNKYFCHPTGLVFAQESHALISFCQFLVASSTLLMNEWKLEQCL